MSESVEVAVALWGEDWRFNGCGGTSVEKFCCLG